MLEKNTQAPTFHLPNQEGKLISLNDYIGKKVVIYFYPKDFTPGCTEQACSYRDNMDEFYDLKTVVIGISEDDVDSHSRFKGEHGLSFDVLSDVDHQAIKAYDVWGEKIRDNQVKMGIIRTTYILDENHQIVEVFKDTDPKTDSQRVLDVVREIKGTIRKHYLLNNGVVVPSVGFGTWQIPNGQEAYQSVMWALNHGYRHIDTAFVYGNESSVGQAIIDSKIDRKEIFVTTKLSANIKDASLVREAFFESLKNLQMDYVDMYLIHNARPWKNSRVDYEYFDENVAVYKELEKLYEEGYVRSIGVSNFNERDLENILARTIVIPVMNQIKFYPGFTQISITEFCDNHNILVEAYSPFATGRIFESSLLEELASKYQKSKAQVIMAWILQQGYLPLPKSVTEARIIENFDVYDVVLEDVDMVKLTNHVSL